VILLVDNYDSFTYNLYQYLGELGAEVRVVRNDELTAEAAIALAPERIVISPGPGTPDQAGITLDLIRRGRRGDDPRPRRVLGIKRWGRPSEERAPGRRSSCTQDVRRSTTTARASSRAVPDPLQGHAVPTRWSWKPARAGVAWRSTAGDVLTGIVMGLAPREHALEGRA
jgi:hypothetical protein